MGRVAVYRGREAIPKRAGTSAIKVDNANNVIIRNSIRGATPNVSVVAGNTVGPLESAGTPIGNPWANIVY